MRAAILGLLALLPTAAPDPVPAFRAKLRDLDGKEAVFWDGFQNRFAVALATFVLPWEKAHSDPDAPQDATWDFKPFHALYGDFAALRESRAEAAEILAGSGDAGAAAAVFQELLDLEKSADGAEAAFEERMPAVGQFMCDQKPGVLRHALAREERRLLAALAKCPGAVPFLESEGWKRAEAGDGRASVLRRVEVIDGLAIGKDPEARAFLEKRVADRASSTLRIAALEALLGFGRPATPALLPLLRDPSPVVRFALLDGLRASKDPDTRWIVAVAEAYPAEPGRMRAEHRATLRALTRADVGDDPAAWKAWVKERAASLEDGTFRRPDGPPPSATTVPSSPVVAFYGLTAATLRPIFVIDGSFALEVPVDVSIQATRNSTRWEHRPRARWMDPPPVHLGVLQREWAKCVAKFPGGTQFGLFALHGPLETHPFRDGRMTKPDPKSVNDAAEFLANLGQNGWNGPFEGLRDVMRAEGLDPSPGAADFPRPLADTVFLLHSASPRGGRFVTADAVVEAVARLNRFRRLAIHCIRINHGNDEAERTLQGIARDSGGTYVWFRKPPADMATFAGEPMR